MIKRIFLLVVILLWISCSRNSKVDNTFNGNLSNNVLVKYAKGFTIQKTDSSMVISILNPWQGATQVKLTYNLVSRDAINRAKISENEIPIPLKRVVCMSSSHVAFIDALDSDSALVGISGTNFVYSPSVASMIQNGEIYEVGYDQGLNYERIAQLKPDVVICYGIGSESISYLNKLREMGIKLMFIGDYLEADPLGKSEWIKVFGYLFGKENKADSIFNSIEFNYLNAKKIVAETTSKPKVFMNLPFHDVWYFPGNENYFVKLINDAGARYIADNLTGTNSYPFSFEKAFEVGLSADIWLNPGTATCLKDIENFDSRLIVLPPFKQQRVYNNNLRMSSGGGNDFWESGALHPDVVLLDLINIFHPDIQQNYKLQYYRVLN